MFNHHELTKKEKMNKVLDNRQKKMNQAIYIRDIFVYSTKEDYTYGESNKCPTTSYFQPELKRLIDHIESLANIANIYHQQYYCEKVDGQYTSKADSLNKITRLSLSEFSLYTSKPIKESTYGLLIEAIEKIAKKQHENVHLLLSSFAVMIDNQIFNMTLYVECGKEPKIHSLCKAMANEKDVNYPKASLFSQEELEKDSDREIKEYIIIELNDLSKKSLIINSNSILRIKTQGNNEYLQCIDICRDYYYSHSKKLMKKIAQRLPCNDTAIIPDQVDHLLTSNVISLRNLTHAKLTDHIAHVDPKYTIFNPHYKPINIDAVTIDHLASLKHNKYSAQSVRKTSNGFLVEHPAFGYHYNICPQEERQLGEFCKEIKQEMIERNANVKNSFINNANPPL